MSNPNFRKITEEAKVDIMHKLDEFEAFMDAGTSDPRSLVTINEIEKEWALLQEYTHKKYSDVVSRYLSAINEKELIELKKANTRKKESG